MKKIIYMMVALLSLCLAGCNKLEPEKHSDMKVLVNGVGEITKDTTIVINLAEISLSGELQMSVHGEMKDVVDVLKVTITRSDTDRIDEFCTGSTCTICDGETIQELEFPFKDNTSSRWYAHYYLPQDGDTDYVVSYKFSNYDKSVTLTVHYDYTPYEYIED